MNATRKLKTSGLDWSPEVPAHWTVKKLGFVASLQSGEGITAEDIKDTGLHPVYGGNGLRGFTDAFTHRGHHVLVGRQGALCGNINYANGEFWASEHALVATPREPISVVWFGELLRAMNLNQFSLSAAQPGLAVDSISALKIPVPPLAEQEAIANFLGQETARLDALVAEKERWLELVAEKRRALITYAVTRGLNPAAPLRDSGISWLTQVPAHWEVKKAKWLFKEIDERTATGEEELLSLRMHVGLVRHNDVSEKQTRAEELIGYKLTQTDDIVVNKMRASSGLVSITPEPGLVSPDYTVLRKFVELDCVYFVKLFGTSLMQAVFRSESKGLGTGASGFLRIYSEGLLTIRLPVPPLDEQRAIVAYISAETAKLDGLRAATERTIGLLKERRAALIAAAVTGKITVPTRVASGKSKGAHEN